MKRTYLLLCVLVTDGSGQLWVNAAGGHLKVLEITFVFDDDTWCRPEDTRDHLPRVCEDGGCTQCRPGGEGGRWWWVGASGNDGSPCSPNLARKR